MGKKKFGHLSFYKELKRKIDEEKVAIECDFWDECIAEVLTDIKDDLFGNLTWDGLLDYIRNKNTILGIDSSAIPGELITQHIKDIIWKYHHKGLITNTDGEVDTFAKGIIVEELAKTILNKITDMTHQYTSKTLKVVEPDSLEEPCSDECWEDLPFESRKINRNRIKCFGKFARENKQPDNKVRKISEMKSEDFPWWRDCIDKVKLEVIQDKTTTPEKLPEKIKNYVSNFFAEHPEIKIDKNTVSEEISDVIKKELEDADVKYDQRPSASVAAKIARNSVAEQPENKFIKLR